MLSSSDTPVPVNWQKRDSANRNKIRELNELLQKRKFQLVFEHNIVAALKKYCPSKEEFIECLAVAKKATIEKRRNLYALLKEHGSIKSESKIGFRM